MVWAKLDVNTKDLGALNEALKDLRLVGRGAAQTVAGLLEMQTKQRIIDGGPAPDGSPWPEWSEQYAKTRHANHSLLRNEDIMLGSIEGRGKGKEATVTASVIYAATHQYGDPTRNIPARPFLGVSAENAVELRDAVENFVANAFQAKARRRKKQAVVSEKEAKAKRSQLANMVIGLVKKAIRAAT